jgi:LPXTG-motif cell wall-anchored protein
MSKETKSNVLEQGQKACAVVELDLEYTGGNVVITDETGAEVFKDDAVVKTTGADMTSMFVVAGVMLALAAAAVVTAKKVKLF